VLALFGRGARAREVDRRVARKLSITLEYVLCLLLVAFVLGVYVVTWDNIANFLFQFVVALFSSLLGAFLIPFGFWGADFAFDAERRREEHVYVPFLARASEESTKANPDGRGRNYTPLEWWNLNWFVITIGVALLLLGIFVIGYDVGKGRF
jgi:hypothetical protein